MGSFTNSASAYGTFDQTGDVFNWNDALIGSASRGLRGGFFDNSYPGIASSNRDYNDPTNWGSNVGFRVANAAPEPNSLMLIGLGGILLASLRRKPFKPLALLPL